MVGRWEEDLKIYWRHIHCAVIVANTRTRFQNTAMLGTEGIAMETKKGESYLLKVEEAEKGSQEVFRPALSP